MFEVVWVRQLGLWMGHSTVAVSLVVAAFLLGMVPGALIFGHRIDRDPSPLKRYAILEAIAGLSAFAVTLAFAHLGASSGAPWAPNATIPRLVCAFVLLLPPTFAMGATLPVLTRFVTRDLGAAGRAFAWLYALNTLGAVGGCLLSGFVTLGTFGLQRTALGAALIDLAVALAAGLWSLQVSVTAPAPTLAPPPDLRALRHIALLAAASGFGAIACEVLWFRALSTFLKASTYAFALLLATWLLGLVIGSAVYARCLAHRPRPWSLVADNQCLVAFVSLLSIALLGRAPAILATLQSFVGGRARTDADLPQLLFAVLIVLAPAAVLGASYPLLATLASQSARGVGRGVGTVAAASTHRGATGSLVTGLWLLPALGTQRCFGLALGIHLAVAVAARARCDTDDPVRGRVLRLIAAFALAWVLLPKDLLLRAVAYYPRARVLAVREGRDGTIAALGYTRASVCAASPHHCAHHCRANFAYQQLVFGAVSYASTILPARRYMRALAHLPMLARPDARDVLQLCFGTGTTAGAFVTHTALRSLTVVDINPDVFAFAPYFAESNHGVLRDPRVHTVVGDGRRYLTTPGPAYDVLSLEPPPPTADGAAALYSAEFYREARERLRAGGILAQWVPLDQQSEALDRALLAAITGAFRYVELWIPARMEGVVLASDQPMAIDLGVWARRWRTPAVQDNLRAVGFVSPESLLATRVMDTQALRRWVSGAQPVTDDRPTVSYYRDHPGPRVTPAEVLARSVDPGVVVADAPATAWTVRTFAAAESLQRAAHERMLVGDSNGAQSLAMAARTLAGPTAYTDYLTTLEYTCLDMDAP